MTATFFEPADAVEFQSTIRGPRRRSGWFIGIFTFGLILGLAAWIFRHAGQWLVVQDTLAHADIIVVLSGGMPFRAIEAARLYNGRAAPDVWISQPVSPSEELAEMHIPFVGEDFYNQRVLITMGVPVNATRITPQPSINTEQEIEEISRLTHDGEIRTVIVVTSAPHTRRVRTIWNRLIGSSPRLIVRHPENDEFDAAHWWRNSQDALDVVREWLGIANAWVGFPARPKRQ